MGNGPSLINPIGLAVAPDGALSATGNHRATALAERRLRRHETRACTKPDIWIHHGANRESLFRVLWFYTINGSFFYLIDRFLLIIMAGQHGILFTLKNVKLIGRRLFLAENLLTINSALLE